MVLSESGLANPGNGVYDITIYPKWPVSAVTLEDFFKYLRGGDGEDGTPGVKMAAVDTLYVEEADWMKYNVAPVRALAKVRSVGTVRDTTYEYVNPYSGGCTLIVTGPGPVALASCKVTFTDQAGNTYTKVSDECGYIYLLRSELPDWTAGSPSMADLSARTKPARFEYDGKAIEDASKIAATCGVPYKVGLKVDMTGSRCSRTSLIATYSVTRTVEGVEEASWGGVDFPYYDLDGNGYFFYRSLGALTKFRKYSFSSHDPYSSSAVLGDHFVTFFDYTCEDSWDRPEGTEPSDITESVVFGDGENPTTVDVHYLPVEKDHNDYHCASLTPDYGLKVTSATRTVIPEYTTIGDLDVTGFKGGEGDEACTSYNEKLVTTADGSAKVQVNKTNYEVILGQTSFNVAFDYSTFGHVYKYNSYYDESTDTFRFKRYDSLLDYLEAENLTKSRYNATVFTIKGTLGGVFISNSVNVPLVSVSGSLSTKDEDVSILIRNVYNGFEVSFDNFTFNGDVFYKGVKGKFVYDESNPYVASCVLGSKTYTFQAIMDSKSAPLP